MIWGIAFGTLVVLVVGFFVVGSLTLRQTVIKRTVRAYLRSRAAGISHSQAIKKAVNYHYADSSDKGIRAWEFFGLYENCEFGEGGVEFQQLVALVIAVCSVTLPSHCQGEGEFDSLKNEIIKTITELDKVHRVFSVKKPLSGRELLLSQVRFSSGTGTTSDPIVIEPVNPEGMLAALKGPSAQILLQTLIPKNLPDELSTDDFKFSFARGLVLRLAKEGFFEKRFGQQGKDWTSGQHMLLDNHVEMQEVKFPNGQSQRFYFDFSAWTDRPSENLS